LNGSVFKTASLKYHFNFQFFFNLSCSFHLCQGESPWLYEAPGAFKNMLLWVNHRYLQHDSESSSSLLSDEHTSATATSTALATTNNRGKNGASLPQKGMPLPLYVTENGCSAPGESDEAMPGALNDAWRVRKDRNRSIFGLNLPFCC